MRPQNTPYTTYLDYRGVQRRIAARFKRPRVLLAHALAFTGAMSAVWAIIISRRLWEYPDGLNHPALFGMMWSFLLLLHAVIHCFRSPARVDRREAAIEAEMRAFIDQHGGELDDDALYDMHARFESTLERQGHASLTLLVFAAVNAISWFATVVNYGTSWAFQMTAPTLVIIIGGGGIFTAWLRSRSSGGVSWFSRLPLGHIAAFAFGSVAIMLAGAFSAINSWDASALVVYWGIVLAIHILLAVVILPIARAILPKVADQPPAKRKHPPRLALASDGELVDLDADDSQVDAVFAQKRYTSRE